MKRNSYFWLASACLLASLLSISMIPGNGSSDWLSDLMLKLSRYHEQAPQELIYLQTDRTFYKPGEDIWFGAFVRDAATHKASRKSQVLHVELLDPRGNSVKAYKLQLDGHGFSRGDFQLGADLPGGLYTIRAWTRWMLNFGPENEFRKELQVQKIRYPRLMMKLDFERESYGPGETAITELSLRNLMDEAIASYDFRYVASLQGETLLEGSGMTNQEGEAKIPIPLPESLETTDGLVNVIIQYRGEQESISRSIPISLNQIDLQFLPEGGQMIAGIRNRVAFKALNELGKAADVQGTIYDEKERKITDFRSFHMGMGVAEFVPVPGKRYFAKLSEPAGVSALYDLPVARQKDYGLSLVDRSETHLKWRLFVPANETVYLIGRVRGKVYDAYEIVCKTGENTFSFPLEKLPIGVAEFALFDGNGVPRSERLVFVNQNRRLHIELTSDKEKYRPTEKATISISVKDEKGNPCSARLSMGVVDDKNLSFADDKQAHILASLLLTSELKGEIEEPNFYFDESESDASEALDYLLMTQGWRRFAWSEIQEASYPLTFLHQPEQSQELNGQVLSLSDQPLPRTRINLVQYGGKPLTLTTKTDSRGFFHFPNLKAGATALYVQSGRKKVKVRMEEASADIVSNRIPIWYGGQPEGIEIEVVSTEEFRASVGTVEAPVSTEITALGTRSVSSLASESLALDEVIVTGFGISRRARALSAAVVEAYSQELNRNQSLLRSLQGRVAGVNVVPPSGAPGAAPVLTIRGNASLSANAQPLVVIDGIPYSEALDPTGQWQGDDGAFPALDPADIASVTVLKDAHATALYGSRGANGVIVVNTRNPEYAYGWPKRNKGKIISFFRQNPYYQPRAFYHPAYTSPEGSPAKKDMRTTTYWAPEVAVDNSGEAKVSFYNSQASSAFRVTVEGISPGGLVGRAETTYSTQEPVGVSCKLPPYLMEGDEVDLPINLQNFTDKPVLINLEVLLPAALESKSPDSLREPIILEPDSGQIFPVPVKVIGKPGDAEVKIAVHGEMYEEELVLPLEIISRGFPRSHSISGMESHRIDTLEIHDLVPGSLHAEFRAFSGIWDQLAAGLEGMLREPHGCFEQVSSTTYPNVIALKLLEDLGEDKPKIREKALRYIANGYEKLAAYETKQRGFDWFGKSPPNEALTAYGLVEFTDMQAVYDGVSEKLMKRTRNFLMDQRNGKGGFKREAKGKYGFGLCDREVANAYITNALVQSGERELEKEINHGFTYALESKDPYIGALVAHTLFRVGDSSRGQRLLIEILDQQHEDGYWNGNTHSMTRSQGASLQIETTALVILAMLESGHPHIGRLERALAFLASKRRRGYFGSTQGTILTLKALSTYARLANPQQSDGIIELWVNGNRVAETPFSTRQVNSIHVKDLASHLENGRQVLEVRFRDAERPLPFSWDISWKTSVPVSDTKTPIQMETRLATETISIGETVRLTTRVENPHTTDQGMTMALVGIPAGLTAQPWQLRELQEKERIDYFEVHDNYVYLYLRSMAPQEIIEIPLDLKAEVAGTFEGPASSGYLYYGDEHKVWQSGARILVR